MPNLRELSKKDYSANDDPSSGNPTDREIHSGCLQRIADATEAMAKSHTDLIEENRALRLESEVWEKTFLWAERRRAALCGVITKLKKKIAIWEQNCNGPGPGCPTLKKPREVKK